MGSVALAKVSSVPSGSEPVRRSLNGVSSDVENEASLAVGLSLTIVIEIVAAADSLTKSPSLTVNVKLSSPL